MTKIDVRTALNEVAQALDVPLLDRVAFQGRVRAERRRRATSRAGIGLVAAATVAAVAAAAAVVAAVLPTPGSTLSPAGVTDAGVANPSDVVGFVVDGHLVVGGPGGYDETGVPARNVLGVSRDLMVLADGTGALVGVPVTADGEAGPAQRLLPGEVHAAWLDTTSGTVTAKMPSGSLLIRSARSGEWRQLRAEGPDVLVSDGERWVDSEPRRLTFHFDEGSRRIPFGGGILGADLTGGTLALQTAAGVRFYDATDGRRLAELLGEGFGRLSPDGTQWVGALDDDVVLAGTRDASVQSIDELPAGVQDIAWTGKGTVVATVRESSATSVWECKASDQTCQELYIDTTGTLQLRS